MANVSEATNEVTEELKCFLNGFSTTWDTEIRALFTKTHKHLLLKLICLFLKLMGTLFVDQPSY